MIIKKKRKKRKKRIKEQKLKDLEEICISNIEEAYNKKDE